MQATSSRASLIQIKQILKFILCELGTRILMLILNNNILIGVNNIPHCRFLRLSLTALLATLYVHTKQITTVHEEEQTPIQSCLKWSIKIPSLFCWHHKRGKLD